EFIVVDEAVIERRLESLISDGTEVVEDRSEAGDRRRDWPRDDRVLRLPVVIRQLQGSAVAEQLRVESGLELTRVFRTQILVAERPDANPGLIGAADRCRRRRIEARGGRRAGLNARRAV